MAARGVVSVVAFLAEGGEVEESRGFGSVVMDVGGGENDDGAGEWVGEFEGSGIGILA